MLVNAGNASKGGMLRHGLSSTKQLKSLNLSKRGLVEKKKKISKKMKHKLKRAAVKSLNLRQKLE